MQRITVMLFTWFFWDFDRKIVTASLWLVEILMAWFDMIDMTQQDKNKQKIILLKMPSLIFWHESKLTNELPLAGQKNCTKAAQTLSCREKMGFSCALRLGGKRQDNRRLGLILAEFEHFKQTKLVKSQGRVLYVGVCVGTIVCQVNAWECLSKLYIICCFAVFLSFFFF